MNSVRWSDPIKVGAIEAKNRVFMASLTRLRGDLKTLVGNEAVVRHYAERAGFGLIFSEAAPISQRGFGHPGACALMTAEQTAFWKRVVDALHERGGRIVAQLWHIGRVADSELNGGLQTVSSSALAVQQVNRRTQRPY